MPNKSKNVQRQPLQIGVEEITPQKAATLLGTMAGNRPVRERAVQRYAREMIAGKWQLNGEAIKVSRTGKLIDGQHRLQAVIMAKKTVDMYVVRGVEDDAVVTLDTGVGRNYHDSTVIRGMERPLGVGAIGRLWYNYAYFQYISTRQTPTHQEIDAIVAKHPSIVESARFIPRLTTVQRFCVARVQGFVHAYTTEAWGREEADLFMHSLNDGTALTKDDPIYLLRKRLVESEKDRRNTEYVLALTIKTWTAWIEGRKLSVLKWVPEADASGRQGEEFPRFSRVLKDA